MNILLSYKPIEEGSFYDDSSDQTLYSKYPIVQETAFGSTVELNGFQQAQMYAEFAVTAFWAMQQSSVG